MRRFQKRTVFIFTVSAFLLIATMGLQIISSSQNAQTPPPVDPFLQQATDVILTATAMADIVQQPNLTPSPDLPTIIFGGSELPVFVTPEIFQMQPLEATATSVSQTATAFVEQLTIDASSASGTTSLSTPIPRATVYALATDRRATFDVLQLSATLDPMLQQATQIIAEATQNHLTAQAGQEEGGAAMPTAQMFMQPPFQRDQIMQATAYAEAIATNPAYILTATIPGCQLPYQPSINAFDEELTKAIRDDLTEIGDFRAEVTTTISSDDCATYNQNFTTVLVSMDRSMSMTEFGDVDTMVTDIIEVLSAYPPQASGIEKIYFYLYTGQEPSMYSIDRPESLNITYEGNYADVLNAYARGLRGVDILIEVASE